MKKFLASCLAVAAFTLPAHADFAISFAWGDIPLCTTGKPNRVDAPAFVIRDLPAGTDRVEFRLVDLDVPSYNHGGGTLKISTSGQLPAGTFKYKSPCPPGEVHTYEWRAVAKDGRKVLGEARAQRKYPE